jgi:HSP20 family protein
MAIARFDPVQEALSLRRAMDQLFEQSFVRPRSLFGTFGEEATFAPMDVFETDQGYEVRVAVPGVRPENIELTAQQNILTVRGRYQEEEAQQRKNWIMQEMHGGTFQRSITFDRPIDVDNIRTSFENGILTISLPVSQAALPRRIAIGGQQAQHTLASGQQQAQQAQAAAAKP